VTRSPVRLLTAILTAFGLAGVLSAPTATAQLRLPPVTVPSPGLIRNAPGSVGGDISSKAAAALSNVRLQTIQTLLRTQHRALDKDPAGELIVRGQILAFAPAEAALDRAAADGLTVLRRESLSDLDAELVVLSVPTSSAVHRTLKRLRQADPTGTYDYNHVYLGVGATGSPASDPNSASPTPASTAPDSRRLGLIDSGVDTQHPAFRNVVVIQWGCEGVSPPDAHGTAVASLLAGRDDTFRGAAPGSAVYAADVYCGRPTGGAVDAIVGAFGWLVTQRVPVINVSLVGPYNATLAAIVSRVLSHGQLLVAAVGNDGPAAPPLYPAAYPGVIGVTGVDARRHVLLEANRGPQVFFAAPGADMLAAALGSGYREVRGTSFAAPIVAGLLATACTGPDSPCPGDAVAMLARQSIDLGRRGRDPVYGYGLVGDDIRIPPRK